MLDIRRLQVLLAIVEEGSVTGAATALGYTPSAISQQLLRLEREAGQPLLDRHARGMTPTDAGVVLATHARKILRQLAAAEADLAEVAGVRRGSVTLGTFPTVGSSFLPLAVRRYRELYPNISLTISSGREDNLVRMLEDGTVAMSLLWDYEWQRIDNDELVLTELFTDPTVLLVGANHRLARRRTVKMGDLAAEPWIIRAGGHPVVEVLDRSAVAAGFTPTIAFQANDYQEAQAMVSVGLGIALAPRTATVNQHPDVRVVSLGDTAPSRRVLVAHRQGRVRGAAELALHDVLVETASSYA
ncbi:LysR family transcriptional regulator [Nocardioides aromaticivorans]|uniref:LysR family transcriptional regulator n=1 Tax=Nocardioides aromaticivorans TaxID=200618 RepID=A0ABX7PGS2_9ACTN|nr:LysR family transcriptional regulator [Nocardioides aromaticivorans]QSR24917.1 LysR family transcriptional regulator [Nocardioides aromaticivorans]